MIHHRLPADVSRCVNSACSVRNTCLRWLCVGDNMRTPYAFFEGGADCDSYWPASNQPQPEPPTTPTK